MYKTQWRSPLHDDVIKWKHFPRYWPFVCSGNSPVTGEFPAQMPVTRSFDVFFDLRLNKRLSKQAWGWWLETPSRPLCRHCNDLTFRSWQTAILYEQSWKIHFISTLHPSLSSHTQFDGGTVNECRSKWNRFSAIVNSDTRRNAFNDWMQISPGINATSPFCHIK